MALLASACAPAPSAPAAPAAAPAKPAESKPAAAQPAAPASATQATAAKPAAAAKPADLKFLWVDRAGEDKLWSDVYPKLLEQHHPGIKVTFDSIPGDGGFWNNLKTKLFSMTAAGTPPDASRGPGYESRQFAKNGMFYDIMPLATENKYPFDQHFEAAFPAHLKTPDGKLNGLPCGLLTMLRYANLELFEKAGLEAPTDWVNGNWTQQQTFENAKKLAQGEGADRIFGLGLVIGGSSQHGAHWFTSNGTALIDQQGEVKIGEPAAIETLELVNEYYKEKLAPFFPADTPGLASAAAPLFSSGKLGMVDVTQASAPNIAKAAKFKWRMMPLAVGTSGKATSVQFVDYWYVHAKTKSPEASYRAIEVLNRPEFEEAMAEGKTGGIPTLKAVADKYAAELGVGDPDKVSLRALQGGHSQEPYYAVNNSEWVAMLNKKLDMLFLGQISAKECADQVIAESKPILAADKA